LKNEVLSHECSSIKNLQRAHREVEKINIMIEKMAKEVNGSANDYNIKQDAMKIKEKTVNDALKDLMSSYFDI
jgi:hypothetical protein